MAALLVAMGVIAVVLSTTLPVFSTMARREREAELIFRGQQYARAVTLFQRKYGNALPPSLDVLLKSRSLPAQAVQRSRSPAVISSWWVPAAPSWPKRSIPHRGSNSLVVAGRRSSSSSSSSNSNDSSSPGAV